MVRLYGGGLLRIVVASTLMSLAFFFGSLNPFLRAAPIGRPAVNERTPAVSVNRYRKGDRLPVLGNSDHSDRTDTKGAIRWYLRGQDGSQTGKQVPLGCDPAFSPVSAPSLATVFGRCMT